MPLALPLQEVPPLCVLSFLLPHAGLDTIDTSCSARVPTVFFTLRFSLHWRSGYPRARFLLVRATRLKNKQSKCILCPVRIRASR